MLSLEELKPYYPEHLHSYERFIIREYLQYKILEIIFESPYENKLAFLGGTCLRIVHSSNRFSEDLDFDNFKLTPDDFTAITKVVKTELERLGYEIDMRNVTKGAYHCYIRFPEILYNEGLTNHKEEKILIRLDSEALEFNYKPDQPLLNKFDVFTQINTTPKDILLAQKFYAVLNRKRNKGRDFFDIVLMLGQGQLPNYSYLNMKLNIDNPVDLRQQIIEKCTKLDMWEMAKDVSPFLFEKKDEKKILLFPKYIEQVKL
ncbi:MAG: nucleotidyl transferase AbiEii/AbiGii toxin family protein [Cyclobacteriaceae bacterium]|nr:nucleotidyl transferase AbiEii/AbiGii toxin family protein [Cyclobacteriaceae bacterium]